MTGPGLRPEARAQREPPEPWSAPGRQARVHASGGSAHLADLGVVTDPKQTGAELDPSDVMSLINRLGSEPGEACVISLAAACPEEAGTAALVFCSVLFGPQEMADESWPQWSGRTRDDLRSLADNWQAAGVALDQWREFTEQRAGFLYVRATRTTDRYAEVAAWISEILAGREAALAPGDPPVVASAQAATALVRSFPMLVTPASQLTSAAVRPATGYLFPLEVDSALRFPDPTWDLSGYPLTGAPHWLLGLPARTVPATSANPGPGIAGMAGIFIGRLERRAWLAGIRADPGADLFAIRLGIDESRVSIADLELDVEEYSAGDLASDRRIDLGDLKLPGPVPAGRGVEVVLPSLGPGLERRVRLYDRDGVLLDATDRFAILEQINLTMTAGDTATSVQVGRSGPVSLTSRLEKADQAEAAYRKMLEEGLAGRIIDDPQHGLPELASLLSQARGHLDVLDPYFGHHLPDWDVLTKVPVAIRVLTGYGWKWQKGPVQKVQLPTAGSPAAALPMEVRAWRQPSAPWHDRVYVWDGGGLSVGTSPSGLGNRVARLDRLSAVEADGWKRLVDAWWNAPDSVPLWPVP